MEPNGNNQVPTTQPSAPPVAQPIANQATQSPVSAAATQPTMPVNRTVTDQAAQTIAPMTQATTTPTMQPATPIAQQPAPGVNGNNQNSSSKGGVIAIVIAIAVICGVGLGGYGLLQIMQKNESDSASQQEQTGTAETKKEGAESVKKESLISNTTWIASDKSEVIFTDSRIDWYRDSTNHEDNFYSGNYKFYIGKEAINYITLNLSEYGVTEDEITSLIDRNDEYNEDNFVVFDIRYDKFVMNGAEQKIARPLVPWYGFILDDNTYLDVANMNTGTYYKFTKKVKNV